jgi:hypothetical protein
MRRRRRPHGWGPLLVALLLLLVLAPIVAHAQGAGADTLTLAWTGPGDDRQVGTATDDELRLSASPIDDTN